MFGLTKLVDGREGQNGNREAYVVGSLDSQSCPSVLWDIGRTASVIDKLFEFWEKKPKSIMNPAREAPSALTRQKNPVGGS